MGRPPRPTRLKVLEGDRKDRINTAEPVPGQGDIVAPDWLDAAGIEVWERLAPDLIAKGVLTTWDVDAFAMACDSVSTYRAAVAQVAAEGMVVTGAKGGQVKHPMLQVVRDSATTFATLAGRFGLTPADRSRLSLGGEDGHQGAERLLS